MSSFGTWRRSAPALIALFGLGCVSACGGGGSSGPPTNLSLSGVRIPTKEVVAGVQAFCAVAKQAHTDPVGANAAFFSVAHNTMHQLVTVLHPNHKSQSDHLLNVMYTFEADLTMTPPPANTGSDADALLQAADASLTLLRVVAPTCT